MLVYMRTGFWVVMATVKVSIEIPFGSGALNTVKDFEIPASPLSVTSSHRSSQLPVILNMKDHQGPRVVMWKVSLDDPAADLQL